MPAALHHPLASAAAFWLLVDGGDGGDDDCWTWSASKTPLGYGQVFREGRWHMAHRFAYELEVGPIPEGLVLDHLCRNRACVNPRHLEPVTHQENILRGTSPSAAHARKTHCPQGHEYTEENTYRRKQTNGGPKRLCRTCELTRKRKPGV